MAGRRVALAGLALVLVATLVFLGWPDRKSDPRQDFYDRLAEGAGCAELFELRGRTDRDHPEFATMTGQLRVAGCDTRSSARRH